MRFLPESEREIRHLDAGAYREYRIPGVCALPSGALALCFECRQSTDDDWARIDIALLISADGGQTWRERIIGDALHGGADVTWNNPTLIAAGDGLHLLYCKDYSQVFHIFSADAGKNWSAPREITDTFHQFAYDFNVCAVGPGHGLALRDDTLVAPVWLANGARDAADPRRRGHFPSTAGFIYSQDGGRNWRAGALAQGVLHANETAVADLGAGEILFNSRHRGLTMRRALWRCRLDTLQPSAPVFCPDLPDPMCFGGMVNLPNGNLAFAHCESDLNENAQVRKVRGHPRTGLWLKTSHDQGETWQKAVLIDAIGGYADVAAHGERVYVFYEQTSPAGDVLRLMLKTYRCLAEKG